MCSGSKSKLCPSNILMENELKKQKNESFPICSVLLEPSAFDDLLAFRAQLEEKDLDADEVGFWYCRRIGSKTMGLEERTPLMIAAMYGSTEVLKYIISTRKADVNRVCGSDRVTALHCAVDGCASSSVEVIKLLLDASADASVVDANGNKPIDLIAPFSRSMPSSKRKAVEFLLKGVSLVGLVDSQENEEEQEEEQKVVSKYPVDTSLPDFNDGIYGTDEFRMYAFKVKPCSRAYSHDWTECPFVHPGENARRRDPRKYPYTCVPCHEFRKGSCPKGDSCEYAHGVFESWLHPAQYRTRLCKDETGCARKVCFFAHKPEELRLLNASTGSAWPSPRSTPVSGMEMPVLPPSALGLLALCTSTPPMSLLASVTSSSRIGGLWQNKIMSPNSNLNLAFTPPALQLPGGRLKTVLSARGLDMEMDLKLLGLDNPNGLMGFVRIGDLKATNLEDALGSFDSSMLSLMQGLSPCSTPTQLQSPNRLHISQNMNHCPSSPARNQQARPGFDTSAAVAATVMNSRSSAFVKRSQSFINRRALHGQTHDSSDVTVWGSLARKLDGGVHGDEFNGLRRSASFGIRSNDSTMATAGDYANEPDVSWVNSLVKDSAPEGTFGLKDRFGHGNPIARKKLPSWVEQMHVEQRQMVA